MNNIIENNKCNKKISIVMAYINRKEQTILTLTQFNFLYLNKYKKLNCVNVNIICSFLLI